MAQPLEELVCSLVPKARHDSGLRQDLVAHCQEILSSRIGQAVDTDIGYLGDIIKRHLLQSSPDGTSTLRFTNLLSRLLDQSILTRKHATLQFLHSLALSSKPTALSPAYLPSLAPPPSSRPSSKPSTSVDSTAQARLPKGKSKAEILREYRAKIGRPHLLEHLILRDTLYLLQGISGKYVHFSPSATDDGNHELVFTDDPKYIISTPTRSLVHRLAEVGHLYMRVDAFVQEREGHGSVGMIEQSLCHHLQTQLTEYYRLIAVLESQMAVGNADGGGAADGGDGATSAREEESGLTLKRLDVWIEEWRLRMRMMSVCVEGARGAHGGALVNLIHGYADNGDPFVRNFTAQLLEEVSKPFFATLHKWLFSGELVDPFAEFFVAVDPELAHVQYAQPEGVGPLASDSGFGLGGGAAHEEEELGGEREGGLKLWESKYRFQKDMLPAFVGEVFGRKIFSTGKSLNFIRYMCHDSDWVATRQKLSNTGGTLQYSDIAGLERSIDTAYQIASQRLFEVFFEKYKLLDHLLALKHYLLLGHGDFIEQLMETISPSLARPANTLYRHNLTTTLETAMRFSNAQNDPPDVLRRLDVRMLEYSHGEIGWDVFTLEYKVDAPIDTVLDPDSMMTYRKLFVHLWKIKRIESTLSTMWMRVAGGARTFLRVPELDFDWHQIQLVMAEMIHFIRQIETYCQLEVIECSWKVLHEFVQRGEGDLDALIEAHHAYLERVAKKVLLLNTKPGREESLLKQVLDVFATILQFREATDDFYNYCLSESARRDSERDADRGVYTSSGADTRYNPDAVYDIISRVREYGSSFSERVQSVVQALQSHADLDCRFLAIRLSFSDFYKVKKDQLSRS
ncbi:gamma-tubulin complex DGRIP91/SPC98 component [Laetiporus sulphureus 93-53]|uniref:Gamma-tubulin complex DGRIP91/SPC98 component n=1 Tax=Laetiporus sulphureus 93-53 TaxID=1314785 RepID=A0A165I4G2_9APHY|nr:gamma-tubulin complex DGRIP91/SPC98 component [Laetiporus sulphureus 93-53]KZT12581.1 gamma-tubulin complex DGRIP91/SPC98 component [Laetiporus sulphureus 93-53]